MSEENDLSALLRFKGLEFKGRRTDAHGVTGAVFGPAGVEFPWRQEAVGDGLGQTSPANARELDRQIIAFRKVVALHHPVTLWLPDAEADFSFEDYEDAVEFAVGDLDNDTEEYRLARQAAIAEITSFQVCAHCKNIESGQAEDRGYEHAAWPCRTAQCWVER